MADKAFANNVLIKTIEQLNSQQDWFEDYSNIFKSLFDEGKFDNQEEIYNAVMQGVKEL